MFAEGLIIGKFYPPHNGHLYLITESVKQTEHLTVVVLAKQTQKIGLYERVDWLKQIFVNNPKITVVGMWDDAYDDYDDDNVWWDHQQIMEAAIGGKRIDVVFSSEEYGYKLADMFGVTHVPIDIPRKMYPISGTQIRGNLFKEWNYLHPVVKQALGLRIVVVGAESTGTTTLSKDLRDFYRKSVPNVGWVPEFGRDYTWVKLAEEQKIDSEVKFENIVWTPEDFVHIAEKQTESENNYFAEENSSPLLICDTDAFATMLFEEIYCNNGARSQGRSYVNSLPERTLYIITDHENVSFEQDGIRTENTRIMMTKWFKETLTAYQKPWIILRGTRAERVNQATRIIDQIVEHKTVF